MSDLVEYPLDDRARTYILHCLEMGHDLSEILRVRLLEERSLETADLVTHLPAGVSDEDLYSFRSGGKLPAIGDWQWIHVPADSPYQYLARPTPDTNGHLAEIILNSRVGDEILVIESNDASKGDPYLEKLKTDRFFVDDHVYFYLQAVFLHADVVRLIQEASSWLTIGGLFRFDGLLKQDKEVDQNRLVLIAMRPSMLFFSAYDRESWVIACGLTP